MADTPWELTNIQLSLADNMSINKQIVIHAKFFNRNKIYSYFNQKLECPSPNMSALFGIVKTSELPT